MKIYIHKILLVIITFISTFVITSSNNITTEFQNIEEDDPIVEVQEKTTIENESDQKELQTEKQKVEESKENKNTTTSTTSTTNNSNNNSTNNNVSNNSVKEEVKQETITETKTEESAPIQNNNQNKSCGIWQSITNCKWDYDTSSACYSAGDHLTELYLNDWMDYNDANPDNPLSRDIKNTECYSVDTDQGTKWYLLVVCYNGTCSKNYKSIYLGK